MKRFFILSLFLLQGCTSLFFYPTRETVLLPSDLGLKYEDVYFETSDGVRLHAWDIPPVLEQGETEKGTVLFLHGNAENISTHTFGALWLPLNGYRLFAPDYCGYGASEGDPSLDGLEKDINAALKYLTARGDSPVFVFGQSLGAALTVSTLAESPYTKKVSAVVIDSGFSSTRRIAREKIAMFWPLWPFQYPLSFLVSENDPEGKVSRLMMPKLFLSTKDDTIVPVHHTQILYENASEPKELMIIEKGGHIRATQDKSARKKVLELFEKAARCPESLT